MPTTPDNTLGSHAALARQVDGLLQTLAGELNALHNPHRQALNALGISPYGATKVPYDDAAFKIWTDLYRRDGNDLETLHHLAIMHHARAIDLEKSSRPDDSNADWERALEFWHTLWRSPAFWDRLAVTVCGQGKRDPIDQLRSEFPVRLLAMHLELALDEKTRPHRANYHVQLAVKSPFDGGVLAQAREDVYRRFFRADVADAVWSEDHNAKLTHQAIERVRGYLAVDPNCVSAISDAVRFVRRPLNEQVRELAAQGFESKQRQSVLRAIQKDGAAWYDAFEKLVAQKDQIDDATRRDLTYWYLIMGQVLEALDRFDEAALHYMSGATVGDKDDSTQRRCAQGVSSAMARDARERVVKAVKAGRNAKVVADARTVCNRVARRDDLSTGAILALASAYGELGDFDKAEEMVAAGLKIEPDVSHEDYDEQVSARQNLESMRESIRAAQRRRATQDELDRAEAEMKENRFEQALVILNRAAKDAPDAAIVLFVRCQCLIALARIDEASKDLRRFRDLEKDSSEALKAAARLEAEIKQLTPQIREFGEQGLTLRKKAIAANNRSDFRAAVSALEQAATHASPGGRVKLNKELANVLVNWASHEVNAVVKNRAAGPAEQRRVFARALERIGRAIELDSKPEYAKLQQNYRDYVTNIDRHAQLIADYGCERALDLQQQAVAAFNKGSHDRAITLLRQALEASKVGHPLGGAPKLRVELSVVLAGAAVAKANSLSGSGAMTGARKSTMLQAKEMLDEACELDPDNENARTNRALVNQALGLNFEVSDVLKSFRKGK